MLHRVWKYIFEEPAMQQAQRQYKQMGMPTMQFKPFAKEDTSERRT